MFHYVIPSLEPNPPPSPLPPWNPSATSNPRTSSQAVEETVFPRKQNQGSHWLHCVEGTLGPSHSESTGHTKLDAKIKCRPPRIPQHNEQCGHVRKRSQVHSGKWRSVEGRRELRTRADSSAGSSFGIHDTETGTALISSRIYLQISFLFVAGESSLRVVSLVWNSPSSWDPLTLDFNFILLSRTKGVCHG